MKSLLHFLVIACVILGSTQTLYAQVDAPRKSIAIGAKEDNEVKKPSLFSLEKSSDVITAGGISIKKRAPLKSLEPKNKKKEVFFMKGPQFAQKTYQKLEKKLNKEYSDYIDKEISHGAQSKQYLGEFNTGSKFVNFQYRDFGEIDGDYVKIILNGEIFVPRLYLGYAFKGFNIPLVDGFNKIEIIALNQGYVGANTAQFIVYDDLRQVVSSNQWNLITGGKATIVVNRKPQITDTETGE